MLNSFFWFAPTAHSDACLRTFTPLEAMSDSNRGLRFWIHAPDEHEKPPPHLTNKPYQGAVWKVAATRSAGHLPATRRGAAALPTRDRSSADWAVPPGTHRRDSLPQQASN